MAEIRTCEPLELYNLLNQSRCGTRLAEINYLGLFDARETEDYRRSHVITAKNVRTDSGGRFRVPEAVEVDSMQHVVVYDSSSSCLQQPGRAAECARSLAAASRGPVQVVRGGFQRFSALYPFLRTEKILYAVTELEGLKPYPVEVLAGLLFMGDQNQAEDPGILRDLKISSVLSISESEAVSEGRSHTVFHIPLGDSPASDLYSCFERICSFLAAHISRGCRVLVVSRRGRSRCSAATAAFLMQHLQYTLQEAWMHLLQCKPSMRPNSGFVQQLSDWELLIRGVRVTDVSLHHF